ncbi:protein tyrosine kinase domain-containing protein [Ditylenchus destructor]|nr:protein tyrosine kinase domain-containing protein [Ditylenchus destructor]
MIDKAVECTPKQASDGVSKLFLPDPFYSPNECNSTEICSDMIESLELNSSVTRRYQYVGFYEDFEDRGTQDLCFGYTNLYFITNVPCILILTILISLTMLIAPIYPLWKFLRKERYRKLIINFLLCRKSDLFMNDGTENGYVDGKFGDPKSKKIDGSDIPNDEFEIDFQHLNVLNNEKLGSGAFAVVYKARLKKASKVLKAFLLKEREGKSAREDNETVDFSFEDIGTQAPKGQSIDDNMEVAVKMLHPQSDPNSSHELRREIEFMKELGYHSRILNIIGCVSSIHNPLLVLEYCANGDLLTFLRKCRPDFEEVKPDAEVKMFTKFVWEISDALIYIKSKGYIHRDVAARNVLLTSQMRAKLSDFGLCRYSAEAFYTTHGGKLPIKWTAPEALKKAEFSPQSDIWSLAVLMFEIFSYGDNPYPNVVATDMLAHLTAGNRLCRPETCPMEIYDLMTQCWTMEPDKRPTADDVKIFLGQVMMLSSK